MTKISKLFDSNRAWAEDITEADPEFFTKLARQVEKLQLRGSPQK